MHFAAELVRWACSGDLDDPDHFSEVETRLLAGRSCARDFPEMLRAWLKGLPPAEEQSKIVNRFSELAEQAGRRLVDLRWWDIMPHDRILLATLEQDGEQTEIVFYWRRTDKTMHPSLMYSQSPTMLREAGILRVTFEAPTYQEVKAQFATWLAKPSTSG
jgi:hypothetical protein